MEGYIEYDNQYKNRIQHLINENPEKKWLSGFYNFMNNQSQSTRYDYLRYSISFVNFIHKEIQDICLDDYTLYLSSIENKTSSYKISVYSGLKKFSLYLYGSKKCNENYMSFIQRPKSIENETTIKKREQGYFNNTETYYYIKNVQDGAGNQLSKTKQIKWKERDLLIIQLLLNTGLRCSGLFKLNINSIDLDNNCLIIEEKGNKVRKILLSTEIINLIIDWLNVRNNILDGKYEDALFISNQKRRMDQSSIARVVTKYSKGITNKNITPHKLRATYGTQLYRQTNDIYFVQQCMGHNNPKTTELYIRGEENENSLKAANIMSEILFN